MSRRPHLGSVRVRTTLAAVMVVGLALVVGAVALVVSLRRSLTSDLEDTLDLRARNVAALLSEGGVDPSALELDDTEDAFTQVVDRSGSVLAASPNITELGPVSDQAAGSSEEIHDLVIVEDDGEREAEDFLVVAVVARTSGGPVTVLTGRTLEFVTGSTGFVSGVLFVGIPLLIALVGSTTWWLVGRALRPVDRIRAEVEAIGGNGGEGLDRRVPVPPTNDEISGLAMTMNGMLERLEAAQERQRRFVSDASHELRSPLAAIRQHAEVARAHPQNADAEDLATVALAEGGRLERLVDDLLLLARADEGRLDVVRRPVDVDDLVFDVADRLRSTTDLRVDTTRVSGGQVDGDPAQLRRLVQNLADNAARHARTTVAFGVADRGGAVVMSIDDDGDGIPLDRRERVFERFVRLDEARGREEGGAGLGLSIVREIARAHGGTVDVSDAPSGGARFEVNLPVRRA